MFRLVKLATFAWVALKWYRRRQETSGSRAVRTW